MGYVHPKGRVQPAEPRLCIAVLNNLLNHLIQFFHAHTAPVFELNLKTAGHTETADGWRQERVHNRLLDLVEPLLYFGHDRFLAQAGILALIPVLHGGKNGRGVGNSSAVH